MNAISENVILIILTFLLMEAGSNLQSKRMNNSKKPGFLPLPFSFPFFLLDASPVAVALHFFPLLGGKVCVQAEEFGGMVALG